MCELSALPIYGNKIQLKILFLDLINRKFQEPYDFGAAAGAALVKMDCPVSKARTATANNIVTPSDRNFRLKAFL